MGMIGPHQQRFEVLPAPQWDVEDLLAAWRVEAPAEPAAGADASRDLQSAEPDDR